ncbi:response regulator transcription factor [Pseudoalteromonas xiamenensis]
MNVVIIEDDEALSRTLARRLQKNQCEATVFTEIAHHFNDIVAVKPDAILLDMKLKEQTSIVSIPALRDSLPDARIVVLTGYGSIATAVEAIRKGADDYLTKPAEFQSILAALRGESVDTTPIENEVMSPDRLEWEHIQRILAENEGNVSQTARQLNMHRRTLQRKLQKRPVLK